MLKEGRDGGREILIKMVVEVGGSEVETKKG